MSGSANTASSSTRPSASLGRRPSPSWDTTSRHRGPSSSLPGWVRSPLSPTPAMYSPFYNRFLPRTAHLMRLLYEALWGKTPKDMLNWSAGMDKAFDAAKAARANAALLAHPSPTAHVAHMTDASDYAVGAVCEQWVGGAWQPLAFFSPSSSVKTSESTAPLTGNCSPSSSPPDTLGSCWRAGSSQPSWTTNHHGIDLGAVVWASTASALGYLRVHHVHPAPVGQGQLCR